MDGTLLCELPGDNFIQYPQAKLEEVETPFGHRMAITALKASFKPKADAKAWPRSSLYGGLLAENVTQAFAAALLRNAIRQLNNVVAHVHDEIVLEVPEILVDDAKLELTSIMEVSPPWAEGLPLKAEPKIMSRYGK
jgi:DNA polymerase